MATGFNNTPPASEFRNATSWGRTRQPKNIVGANGTSIGVDDLTASEPTVSSQGYSTENQRFLHLLIDTVNDCTVTIWAYSHAFGAWGILNNASGAQTIAVNNGKKAQVFEIFGIDKIYFQSTGTNDFGDEDLDRFYAACSTF